MSRVTVFTAERMKEIEDTTVVSGLVDVHGDLILSTREGTPFNAGNVKGPPGNDGVSALDGTPSGTITLWTSDVAPKNWLICDGSAVSRSQYPSLFDAIGVKYGAGDGVNTFNLPNLKGRTPVGKDLAQTEFNALAKIGGEKAHLLTVSEMPAHTHQLDSSGQFAFINSPGAQGAASGTNWGFKYPNGPTATQSVGGGAAFNVLQPYSVVNFIIKAVAGETTGDDELVQRMSALEANFSGTPAGTMTMWGSDVAPANWLLCDGAVVSRATYAALFAAIGIRYGAGDGSTTFNLPNLKGRVPVGRDTSQTEFDTMGEIGGAKTHTLTANEMPSHAHPQNVSANPGVAGGISSRIDYTSDGVGSSYPQGINTNSTGGGQPHNNLPPYQVVNYIIKFTNGDTKADSQLAQRVGALEGGTAFFIAERDKIEALRNVFTGGGTRKVLPSGVSWSERFIVLGAGNDSLVPGGYFNIDVPPDGTVIPVYNYADGEAASVTVANRRIPIPDWSALYYNAPLGNASQLSDPSRFFIMAYRKDRGVVLPRTAIMVVTKNIEYFSPMYTWGDGRSSDPWKYHSYANGWVNYDGAGGTIGNAGYAWGSWKFDDNGKVVNRGLISNGAINLIMSFPRNLAPDNRQIFNVIVSTGAARIDVYDDGVNCVMYMMGYYAGGTNAWVSLTGLEWFPKDAV